MSRLREIRDVLFDAVLSGALEVIQVKRSGEWNAAARDATELVTTADQLSDAAILSVFHARLPQIDSEISFYLEESGHHGLSSAKEVGADPLDGTNHFICAGTSYSVQAHYVEDGVPQIGVVFQPEVFLPLEETDRCLGRIVSAIRGEGAFMQRSEFAVDHFELNASRQVHRKLAPETKRFVACIPVSARMLPDERDRVRSIIGSDIVSVTTGVGGAGGNVMLTVFGGQQVYANFGAGLDLDLIPPQVIAVEAGLTVWGIDRKAPLWHVRKQPFLVAPSPQIAELFLAAAGY